MSLMSPWLEEGKIANLPFVRGRNDGNIDTGDQPRSIRQGIYYIWRYNSGSSLNNNIAQGLISPFVRKRQYGENDDIGDQPRSIR